MSDVPVRLLRETLRENAATAPSAACLDADTLAAWSDGALNATDRAAAESHASGCARCQAMLAAMAITAPPATARKWWHAGTYKWLTPLAAAAAAAVLWFAVPRPAITPQAPAANGSPVAAPPPRLEQRADDAATVRPRKDLADDFVPLKPDTTASVRLKRDTTTSVRVKPDTTEAQTAPLPPSTSVRADAFASTGAPAAPPPAAPPQAAAAPQAAPSAVAPPPLEEAVVVAPNANESVQLRSERAAAVPQALAKASPAPPEIVSPDRNVRWRLRNPGRVDRSTDGGLNWQTQATGVATPLVSGAAPAPTICWLVGRGGVVLRSTDGATWQRVGLSEAIDLTAIRASDADHAMVTAVDGRVFTTADGGTTWR